MKFTYNATLRRVWIFAHWTISDGDAVQSTSATQSCSRYVTLCYTIIRGTATPIQAWTGPEGSRKFRVPDFMTIGT